MADNYAIIKAAQVSAGECSADQLKKINKYTLSPLTAEDVFVFKVATCDNEVDRDFEHFTVKALKTMAKLFVGKTVVKDHVSSADNQIARIFDAEVTSTAHKTTLGEDGAQLIAHCYMLRTDSNADMIRDITGGIKREVSISARGRVAKCGICGVNKVQQWCDHRGGMEYDGKLCTVALDDVFDAYELSFIGVPSQRAAGVTKSYGADNQADDKPAEPPPVDINPVELRIRLAEAFLTNTSHESEDFHNE